MPILSRNLLAAGSVRVEASTSAKRPDIPPVGILQIGDGNFLRGFADWMIEVANDAGVFNGQVTMAAARGPGAIPALRAQDGLFTVLMRGVQGGELVNSTKLITCVRELVDPSTEWLALLACAGTPSLRFLISNTTEAGIAYVDEPNPAESCPQSFPAKLTALLWERFVKLGGNPAAGLIVLPCELVEDNGSKLRHIVLQHAVAWGLPPVFVAWIEQHNHFLNTLVDRIVPGLPREADDVCAKLGYEDGMLVAAEPFHLWVIEGSQELAEEFPLHKAALNVIWTDDLKPYRSSKVRVLNGAHTAMAMAAFGAGLDSVKSVIDDAVLSKYLHSLMFQEIVPFVPRPEQERNQYAAAIMERFANPYIRHELLSIALNSVSKWQVRVLPTIKDYAREHGRAPKLLSFSLAALLDFYHGSRNAAGEYQGLRDGQPYAIKDNADAINAFDKAWHGWIAGEDVSERVRGILADARLWSEDLTAIPLLSDQVATALNRIKAVGSRAAIAELLD
ncbi:MAG: tagaturonate reductase [Rhodocyclales bacterium]|nr:tagaturonate reductase [Rhodocyclales bacterium]